VHAPALASAPGVELAAIWGRNQDPATAFAADFGAMASEDFDAFLAGVDGVAFAVPPAGRAELAVRAAEARRHGVSNGLGPDNAVTLRPSVPTRAHRGDGRTG
jgi:predicted dehydrogenase